MIALIAGTGTLPLDACKKLMHDHASFMIITLFPEDNAHALSEFVRSAEKAPEKEIEIIAQEFYKPGQIFNLLKQRHVTKILFIGKVDKRHLLSHLKLDWFAIKLLASVVSKSDKDIMERLVGELESHGFEVLKQNDILGSLHVTPGVVTGTLTQEIQNNITIGIKTAIALSQADIGQTIVIKDTMVLAVEAIEGSDACIKRGIELGGNNVIICKATRLDQNKKFDLPTLGPASLQHVKKGEVQAVAWLSSHTLIVSKDLFIKRAEELGITLVSVE